MLDRDPKVHSRHLTDAELKRVADYADKHGQTKTEIAFNLAVGTVRRAMRIHGVKPRKTGRPPEYTDSERRTWMAFKGSALAAAMHFGVGRNTILRERRNQRIS